MIKLSAIDCEDEPDTGVSAGVESRTWNNLYYYATNITYTCSYGSSLLKSRLLVT